MINIFSQVPSKVAGQSEIPKALSFFFVILNPGGFAEG
jgi:hypothetical protein